MAPDGERTSGDGTHAAAHPFVRQRVRDDGLPAMTSRHPLVPAALEVAQHGRVVDGQDGSLAVLGAAR